MLPKLNRLTGIHPGAVLKRELKKRQIRLAHLAREINEYPQTINAITKQKRRITPILSIKLGEFFRIESEYFAMLQASYDVAIASKNQKQQNSFLSKLRPILFWDVDIKNIDVEKHKGFVIERVIQRGNKQEKQVLTELYSEEEIQKVLKKQRKNLEFKIV